MTATIQEEPEHIEVKDLYFKSAVDVTAWNFRFEMQVTYIVEEAAANRSIVRMNPIRRKNNFKFWLKITRVERSNALYARMIIQQYYNFII